MLALPETMPRTMTPAADLHRALLALARRAKGIDLWVYEPLPVATLRSELVPLVAKLVAETRAVVERAGARFGDVASREGASAAWGDATYASVRADVDVITDVRLRRPAGLLEDDGLPPETLGDLTFLSSLELGQREARLERALRAGSAADVLIACDSAIRRVIKAVGTVEQALGRAALVAPSLDATSELDDALRTRRAVASVRRLVLADGAPDGAEALARRLRLASVALTSLVGWQAYPLLAVGDRLELGQLRRRLAEWLDGDDDERVGRALFADLVRCVRSLARINSRRDLVEHDRAIVERATRELDAPTGKLSPDTVAAMRGLAGLADGVDALLDSSWCDLASAWRPVLERLAQRFAYDVA